MLIAVIFIILLCVLLSRFAFATHKKRWRFFVINSIVMICYNIAIWGYVSLFAREGGTGIVLVFCDIVLTSVHLLIFLIAALLIAVKEQSVKRQ